MRSSVVVRATVGAVLLLAACAAPVLASRLLAPAGTAPAHPSRIIVKYRPGVTPARAAGGAGGSASLDALDVRFVRVARPLVADDVVATGGRAVAYAARVARVRDRYPMRAARRPAKAVLPDLSNVYVLDVSPGSAAEAAAAFAADPGVEYAQLDYRRQASLTPNDPFFSSTGSWGQSYPDLWGLHAIDAAGAWDTSTGSGIVVAVVDTGVDDRSPELAPNLWVNPGEIGRNHLDDDGNGFVDDVNGWDFVKSFRRPRDRNGHGTHVAGTVAAAGNNGVGVVGVAFGARVMSVVGLDKNGQGFDSDLIRAILYAAENGADVISNSWGGGGDDPALTDAIATAVGMGAVVVFAAGNDGFDTGYFGGPPTIPDVIAVAATAPDGARADFSNYGDAISVAAPGVDILSLKGPGRLRAPTVARRYRRLSGTSMATPHVSGLVALLLAVDPSLTLDEVRWHVELSADQPGSPGWEGKPWNPFFGWGRIDAARVFATPPVTTRLRTKPFHRHVVQDMVVPDFVEADFRFTTLAPVDWTLGGSPWLQPTSAAGSGDAIVPITLDTTGVPLGPSTGALTVSAPAAVDGGASVDAALEVHRNERVGDEILVAGDLPRFTLGARSGGDDSPRLATDGTSVLAVWPASRAGGGKNLMVARLDPAGTLGAPVAIPAGQSDKDGAALDVAFDGQNYLVVWRDVLDQQSGTTTTRHESILASRVAASGVPIDPTPLVLASRTLVRSDIYFPYIDGVRVAFDGTAYPVVWTDLDDSNVQHRITTLSFARVGTDGTVVSPARVIYATPPFGTGPDVGSQRIACLASGDCMTVWHAWEGEVDSVGRGIVNLYGMRLRGDQVLDDPPLRVLKRVGGGIDALAGGLGTWPYEFWHGIATDGSSYLVVTIRRRCNDGGDCDFGGSYNDVAVSPVTPDGVALHPEGIRVDNTVPATAISIPRAISFDGTNYVVTFLEIVHEIVDGFHLPPGGLQLFAARVTPGGQVLDDEPIGLLLNPAETAISAAMASTVTGSVLAWHDLRVSTPGTGLWGSLYAQRVLPH